MKTKLLSFLVAIISTTALRAGNVITYTATEKLPETTNQYNSGLHTNAFNVAISSHTFSSGTGTITFNGEVTTIGDRAFYDCSGLTSITIPTSVTTIGLAAFRDCSGLTKTNYTGTIADWCKIEFVNYSSNPINCSKNLYIKDVEVKNLVIPSSVTTIGDYAFVGCSGLTSVTIPSSVITIGDEAFNGCDSLTKTNYTGTIADWCRIEFVGSSNPTYYSKNLYINDVEVKDLVIPEGVDTIGNFAFIGCSGLTSVSIPSSVTMIGDNAFCYCSGLTDIYSYAKIPPTSYSLDGFLNGQVFYCVSEHCYIHVPAGTMRAYQLSALWSRFYHFFEISEIPGGSSTDQVGVQVTNNTAIFSWPINPTASSYTLVIKKNNEVFCSLIFNSLGQLVGMSFAPTRGMNSSSKAESTNYGYSFAVDNLDNASTYDYIFTAKDNADRVLSTHTGQFKTADVTSNLEDICDDKHISKFMMDGQVYIRRGDKIYTLQGVEQ